MNEGVIYFVLDIFSPISVFQNSAPNNLLVQPEIPLSKKNKCYSFSSFLPGQVSSQENKPAAEKKTG